MGTAFYLFKALFWFFRDIVYSIYYFKNIKVFSCNHLTIGLKYLHSVKAVFPHPVGIVIGSKVILGKNCKIYQNVTIGTKETLLYETATYPVLGENVTIFANSVVFGDITIGSNSIIGAGSVVFFDVPPNSVVVGNPAKIVDKIVKL